MSVMKKGYTLMEVIMVVFIVGLLSSLVVMRYDSQRKRTAINVTKANLESIRTAIAFYYDIEGTWPVGNLSELYLGTAPSGKKYLGKLPSEEITHKNSVTNVSTNTGGWFYDLPTHTIIPNLTGTDATGVDYSTY
jgi:prepilin-type N-terminal cleavage/methylation domain-containing protein